MLVMLSVAVPVFCNVKVVGKLELPVFTVPKFTVRGPSCTTGWVAVIPVPVMGTEPFIVPMMVNVPLLPPRADGLNEKMSVQLLPGGIDAASAQDPPTRRNSVGLELV